MARKEHVVVYDGEIYRTPKARLLKFDEQEVWIAERLILWEDEEAQEVILPDWYIEEKEIDPYIKE